MAQPSFRSERFLRGLLVACSTFFVLLFLYASLRRLHYGFDFDRMEGAALVAVYRIRHGLPIYCAPSFQYAPFLYSPLFFYAGAFFSKVVGISFAALRLTSLLATLGTLVLLFIWVRRETQRALPAIAAVGCYLSLYSFLQGWMDMGRVDALSVFFLMLALFLTRFAPSWTAAIVWVLAVQTKQSLLILPFLFFALLFRQPRRMIAGIVTYAALLAGSILWMQHVTSGWYSFYVFGTVAQLQLDIRQGIFFPINDFLGIFPLATLLLAAAALFVPMRLRSDRTLFYGATFVLLFFSTWFIRGHQGANVNALMPLYAWVALLFGLALGRLLTASATWTPMATALVLLAAIGQLAMHTYNPGQWLGTSAMASGRLALREAIRKTPGDVWVVNHAWEAMQAGKPEHAEMDALDAVLFRPVSDRTRDAVEQMHDAVQDGHLDAIVLDHAPAGYLRQAGFTTNTFHEHYGLQIVAPGADRRAFVDVPQFVFVPCAELTQPTDVWQLHTATINRTSCP